MAELVSIKTAAKSSPAPRFDLVPYAPQVALAERFEFGGQKYGDPWQYRQGLGDTAYTCDRLNHIINHAKRLLAKLNGHLAPNDDEPMLAEAAAIMWGGAVVWESIEAMHRR